MGPEIFLCGYWAFRPLCPTCFARHRPPSLTRTNEFLFLKKINYQATTHALIVMGQMTASPTPAPPPSRSSTSWTAGQFVTLSKAASAPGREEAISDKQVLTKAQVLQFYSDEMQIVPS